MKALTGGKLLGVDSSETNKMSINIPKNYPVKSAANLTAEQLAFITRVMDKSSPSPSSPTASIASPSKSSSNPSSVG